MTSKKPPIYEMTIALNELELCVWRRSRVDPLVTLPLLHLIIQRVMGWEDRYQHCFLAHGHRYESRDPDLDS
jgi:hypothetical protein